MKTNRSLTFKLTGIVVLISLLSVILVTVFIRYATVSAFDRMLVDEKRTDFIVKLTAYYEENGTWRGINEALQQGMAPPPMFMGFVLVDAEGRVVIADRYFQVGQHVPLEKLKKGLAIEVEGRRVGTVLENALPPVRQPEDEAYLERTNQALLLAALSVGCLALLSGFLASRSFTRPLCELTKATKAMAQGDLEQTVPVRTKDELGELAASFNRMSADLARSNALRRQMTADIAHDLRTPLTVIKGYTEALRDGDLKPKTTIFATMYQEAEHLSRLIDDLRTLSLADAGELTLNKRAVSLRELLEQAQSAYLPLAGEADIRLGVTLDEGLPVVFVDPERLARVIGNLLRNALRHTPAGGAITLIGCVADGGVHVCVQDTGSGIAAKDLPFIFERFYRGDSSRHNDDGESGLGLAIVKSLVEAHGGTISVSSTSGEGTTFEIFLPVAE